MRVKKVLPIKSKQEKTRHYTEVEKVRAVAFTLQGLNATRVSEMTGIPVLTIHWWKKQPWWYDVTQQILKEEDEEINSNFSRIVKKAQKQIEDRIDNGDFIFLRAKDGTFVKERIEMRGRDLSTVASQGIDKRQLLLERPTSRTEKITVKERLTNLAEEFKKFSKAKDVTKESVEVSNEET